MKTVGERDFLNTGINSVVLVAEDTFSLLKSAIVDIYFRVYVG